MPHEVLDVVAKPQAQAAGEYWMLPRILICLGHSDDAVLKQVLLHIVESFKT